MARSTNLRKREAEARFPHKVDIAVPEFGLGNRLDEMLLWCRANVPAGTWAQHHHSEGRLGEAAVDCARFYFIEEADAEQFRRQWLYETNDYESP